MFQYVEEQAPGIRLARPGWATAPASRRRSAPTRRGNRSTR